MTEINDFVAQFKTSLQLDEANIVKRHNRYFLLSEKLQQQIPKSFFYAGEYLGSVKGTGFFPSFLLLSMIAKTNANKIVLGKKTSWLFICGRDIFKRGLLQTNNLKKGNYALVMNEHGECLGYGQIMINIRGEIDMDKVAVKNILDLGDFLRREKQLSKQQYPRKSYQRNRK